jgi:hypothetical protein
MCWSPWWIVAWIIIWIAWPLGIVRVVRIIWSRLSLHSEEKKEDSEEEHSRAHCGCFLPGCRCDCGAAFIVAFARRFLYVSADTPRDGRKWSGKVLDIDVDES